MVMHHLASDFRVFDDIEIFGMDATVAKLQLADAVLEASVSESR